MQRPPRPANASPFAIDNVAYALLQGAGLAAVLLGSAWLLVAQGWAPGPLRATVFVGLVLGLFLLVLANRDLQHSVFVSLRLRNAWLLRMLLAVVAMLVLIFSVPWLRHVMGFGLPAAAALGVVALILLAAIVWMEGLRMARLYYLRS
jgi:Ca2+-transporting ATPase